MKVEGTNLIIPDDDRNLKVVRELYGKTHDITACLGTEVILSTLPNDVSVCYGDGKSYHFRLRKKP